MCTTYYRPKFVRLWRSATVYCKIDKTKHSNELPNWLINNAQRTTDFGFFNRRQWRQSVSNIVRVQTPAFPFPRFPFPLKSRPLNPARGPGECCKPTIVVHFEGEGTQLEAFKMHGFKQQKTYFPYIFMKKFLTANYCFHSVVTLLWGSKPQRTLTTNLLWGSRPVVDPHGIDAHAIGVLPSLGPVA